jgi:hypothetical protein
MAVTWTLRSTIAHFAQRIGKLSAKCGNGVSAMSAIVVPKWWSKTDEHRSRFNRCATALHWQQLCLLLQLKRARQPRSSLPKAQGFNVQFKALGRASSSRFFFKSRSAALDAPSF